MTSETRDALIEAGLGLVRRHGYSAFSYADLAAAVGIRKPSIHHHFPGKEDLGVAMVAAYSERVAERLRAIEGEATDPIERVRAYAMLYREGLPAGQGCLCGVLASELAALPPRIQASVRQFFAANLRWLETVLAEGLPPRRRAAGVAKRDARTVLAALQGAMFVALSLGDPASFDLALDGLLAGLSAARA